MRLRNVTGPRGLGVLLLGATLLVLGGFSVPPAAAGLNRMTEVYLRYIPSPNCLDADNSQGSVNGMKAQIWACHGGANQRWRWGSAVDWTTITNGINGKCLDADTSRGVYPGMKVHLWSCHGGINQKWSVNPSTARIQSALPEYGYMCLDADNSAGSIGNGAKIQLWPCHAGLNQAWADLGS
jgi:hypothetical protein